MFERQGDLATVAMSGFRAPPDLLDSSFSTTSSSTPSSEKSLSFTLCEVWSEEGVDEEVVEK